jgi:hypothetical protein
MSWTPISNTVPQYEENGVAASGFYIKFYQSGTTTPTAMAIDNTGATTLDKCELNTEGYPINGSGAVFIPHIDQKYKILLYRNATDADNNNFSNKVWEVDILFPLLTASTIGTDFDQVPLNTDIVYPVANVAALRALTGVSIGQSFYLEGHTDAGIGGGHLLCAKAQTIETDNNGTLFIVDGFVIERPEGTLVTPQMFGAIGDGAADDLVPMQAAHDLKVTIYYPDGIYRISAPIVPPVADDGTSKLLYMKGTQEALVITKIRYIKCKILCDSHFISSGIEDDTIVSNIQGIAFVSNGANNNFFNGYQLELSVWQDNIIEGFDYGLRGKCSNLSRIERNHFVECKVSAISNVNIVGANKSFTDSYIIGNYISGSVVTADPSLGAGLNLFFMNHCVIADNFIDFWYEGCRFASGLANAVTDNQLDFCFRGVVTKQLLDTSIKGNIYTNIKKTNSSTWTNPTTEMINDDWIAHNLEFGNQRMSISDNQCSDSEIPINMASFSNTKIITSGNTSSILDSAVIINRVVDGGDTDDGLGLQIAEVTNIYYFSLPAIPAASFKNHTIIYQDNIAINNGTEWRVNGAGANLIADYLLDAGSWFNLGTWTQDTTGEGSITCVDSTLLTTPATLAFEIGATYVVTLDIDASVASSLKGFLGGSATEFEIGPVSTGRQIVTTEIVAGSGFLRFYTRSDGFRGTIYKFEVTKKN